MSSNPRRSPAIEKGWQGNPAQQTSKFGMSSMSASVISLLKNL